MKYMSFKTFQMPNNSIFECLAVRLDNLLAQSTFSQKSSKIKRSIVNINPNIQPRIAAIFFPFSYNTRRQKGGLRWEQGNMNPLEISLLSLFCFRNVYIKALIYRGPFVLVYLLEFPISIIRRILLNILCKFSLFILIRWNFRFMR